MSEELQDPCSGGGGALELGRVHAGHIDAFLKFCFNFEDLTMIKLCFP